MLRVMASNRGADDFNFHDFIPTSEECGLRLHAAYPRPLLTENVLGKISRPPTKYFTERFGWRYDMNVPDSLGCAHKSWSLSQARKRPREDVDDHSTAWSTTSSRGLFLACGSDDGTARPNDMEVERPKQQQQQQQQIELQGVEPQAAAPVQHDDVFASQPSVPSVKVQTGVTGTSGQATSPVLEYAEINGDIGDIQAWNITPSVTMVSGSDDRSARTRKMSGSKASAVSASPGPASTASIGKGSNRSETSMSSTKSRASSIKSNDSKGSSQALTAKQTLFRMYAAPPHKRQLVGKDFTTWHNNALPHLARYTSRFTCPITKERFASGRHGNEGTYNVVKDPTTSVDVVWFAKKVLAEHAAAARAVDCFRLRRSEWDPSARFCNEEPYLLGQGPRLLPDFPDDQLVGVGLGQSKSKSKQTKQQQPPSNPASVVGGDQQQQQSSGTASIVQGERHQRQQPTPMRQQTYQPTQHSAWTPNSSFSAQSALPHNHKHKHGHNYNHNQRYSHTLPPPPPSHTHPGANHDYVQAQFSHNHPNNGGGDSSSFSNGSQHTPHDHYQRQIPMEMRPGAPAGSGRYGNAGPGHGHDPPHPPHNGGWQQHGGDRYGRPSDPRSQHGNPGQFQPGQQHAATGTAGPPQNMQYSQPPFHPAQQRQQMQRPPYGVPSHSPHRNAGYSNRSNPPGHGNSRGYRINGDRRRSNNNGGTWNWRK